MPTPVDGLTPQSGYSEMMSAVSACIKQEINGGRPQPQAIAMCIGMAEQKTGKKIPTSRTPPTTQPMI